MLTSSKVMEGAVAGAGAGAAKDAGKAHPAAPAGGSPDKPASEEAAPEAAVTPMGMDPMEGAVGLVCRRKPGYKPQEGDDECLVCSS